MKNETIIMKVSEKFKEDVTKLAQDKGLNLSAYIRMILTEKVKESEDR